ncbi:MAG: DUF1566 domain-containing protein [Proteobacteria bacterium]|nr:DUF1566 domain-containing protein [Pseudomonadota bacterium]
MNENIRRKKFNNVFSIYIIGAVLLGLALFGCTEGEGDSSSVTTDTGTTAYTGSVNISVSLYGQSSRSSKNATGTIDDVTSIKISVVKSDDSTEVMPETDLVEVPEGSGNWEVTLTKLPVNVSLDFVAYAYDSQDQAIFGDIVIRTISQGVLEDITLQMESINEEVQSDNPKVVSVTMAQEIKINSTGNVIFFEIAHSEDVEYTLEVEAGTITSPLSGIHDTGSVLEVAYDAPSSAGSYEINVTASGLSSKDSISAVYTINVVDTIGVGSINVVFGPAIVRMHFLRASNMLQISGETSPTDGVTYSWSGTDSFSSLSASQNPVVISPFSDSDQGVIILTVTDENGIQASLTITISAGEFPYTVNDPNLGVPAGTVVDIATGLLWQDNLNAVNLNWNEAVDYCANTLDLGGYNDWRLPARDELSAVFSNKGILTLYQSAEYWSSTSDDAKGKKAWIRHFGNGNENNKSKNDEYYVRCVRNQ